jgi:hypothetical protein
MSPIYTGGIIIVGAVLWIVCAVYAYRHAPDLGRTPLTWGILGIIFGPIALMVMYLLPKQSGAGGSASQRSKDAYAERYEVPKKR